MIALGRGGAEAPAEGAPQRRRCNHDPLRVVAEQPLFASLTEEECRGLVDRSVCRTVARGEVLFREGEACRGLHLLVEGRVRVYRSNPNGQEQVLRILSGGESLGDVSLFDEGPYMASARVMEPGRVLFLPFEEVHSLFRTHPETAHAMVRELGERVRALAALVDQLALHDVPSRVALAVLRQAESDGVLHVGGVFLLPRTQEELAAELGTTREGVARGLRELREAGVVKQRGPRVEVLDPAGLARLAGRRRETRP